MVDQSYLAALDIPQFLHEDIRGAYNFAAHAHADQFRKSGEEYIIHPIAVAESLWKNYHDRELMIAGLLHDVLEDCPGVQSEDIYKQFGPNITFMVEAVSKNYEEFSHETTEKKFSDYIEKLLWAGLKDVRVLLLKIADRNHNMSTLMHMSQSSQMRISFETHCLFSPLNDIIEFGIGKTMEESEHSLRSFVEGHQIKDEKELKETLLSSSLNNLSTDLFGMLQRDTMSVVWAVHDWDSYVRLVEDNEMKDKIVFLSLSGNDKWFRGLFVFKGNMTRQMKDCLIDSYQSITI